MKPTLELKVESLNVEKHYQAIKFNGDFDKAGYTDVRDELNSAVKSFGGTSLVFDFTHLQFINSEGIGYLMEVHTHLVKADKQLIIVGANAHVKDVFGAIGIKEIISLYLDMDSFLKKLS